MQTSHEGRALVEAFEGLRLQAYRHPGDLWTIGYGHTSQAGAPRVTSGLRITSVKADQILMSDLKVFEIAVGHAVRVPLSQGQFDACVDLAFNLGGPRFAASEVARRINAGDPHGAAAAFLLYVRSAGAVNAGLMRRRRAEAALFAGDHHTALTLAASNDDPMPGLVDDVALAA